MCLRIDSSVMLLAYNPPEKKNLTFLKFRGCFGRVLEVFLDDCRGTCWDRFGRLLKVFERVVRQF